MTGESVLRFGEDGNAVTELAQVRELRSLQLAVRGRGESTYLMATYFKLGEVPSGIFVSGALDVTERGLIGGDIAVNVEGYLNFALLSAPRLSKSSGVYTYTSRTRVSGANPLAPQSLCTGERSASRTLEQSQ